MIKQYTEIEELTPDILHSFVDRIYIGETEVYEGQKFQDIKIVYNLVGAIDLPQYAMKIYRAELYNRFQEINAANYHTRITIERNRRYYENKVYYYVTVENVPDREDVASIQLRSDTFEGKKRHEALKLFETLRKVYPRAELVKKIKKSQWKLIFREI